MYCLEIFEGLIINRYSLNDVLYSIMYRKLMLSSHSQEYERLRKILLSVLSPFLMKNFIRKKKLVHSVI